MDLISWIVVGLIAGWLAGQVMKGGGYGLVGDIVIGIIGALFGGWLAINVFNIAAAANGINVGSIVVAFLGAVAFIWIVRMLPGRSPV
ncbi:MAG: GlsB/YeaQ/YmgE family stress response membrane protein [Ardenticatenia bacterium]|nr:GlsB/YeaQ/YmgE family stress response membrane protein [Ardenticatenia bacterium]